MAIVATYIVKDLDVVQKVKLKETPGENKKDFDEDYP